MRRDHRGRAPAAMPKSKHRRKPPKAPPSRRPPPEWLELPNSDPALDSDLAAALAQAEAELAADIAAADEDDDPGPYLGHPEDDGDFQAVAGALLAAVEDQVRTNDPPEVAATLARLVADGYDRDEAISMIGAVLVFEMNQVMLSEREFDAARYADRLAALPTLPDFS